MSRKRPGRVRTKRTNRREPLRLSTMDSQDFNVRRNETKSIVCPDCRTWRRVEGETTLKIVDHCDDRCGTKRVCGDSPQHTLCGGSEQLVVIDINVQRWQARQNRLVQEAMPAEKRRAARQFYKPIPAPTTPIAAMPRTLRNSWDALAAYAAHRKWCVSCTDTHRCGDAARLDQRHQQAQRTQPRRDILIRERRRFDRSYERSALKAAAARWAQHAEATADTWTLTKRSGTAIEEFNNQYRWRPRHMVSNCHGPNIPREKLTIA